MKALKYTLVILLLVAAIIAGAVHYYREAIVREAVNLALGDFGMRATALSVDTIGTDIIRLSRLTIEQDNGTRYAIADLAWPLSFPSARAELITIGRLAIAPANTDAEPAPLAPVVRTLLQLPSNVPNTEVTIGRLDVPGFVPTREIVWRTAGPRQQLSFRILSLDEPARAAPNDAVETAPDSWVDIAVDVDPLDDATHRLTLHAATGGHPDALVTQLLINDSDSGVAMAGDATLATSPWLPVLESAGLLPADLAAFDAALAGPLTLALDDAGPSRMRADASLSLAKELAAQYRTDDRALRLRATTPARLEARFEYPSLAWSAGIDRLDIRVGTDLIGDIPMRLRKVECRAGMHCAVRVAFDTGPVEFGATTIGTAKGSVPLTLTADPASPTEQTRVDVGPAATLALTRVELPAGALAAVEISQLAGARLLIDSDGWRIDTERANLQVDGATDRERLLASAPVQLKKLRVRDGGATADSEISIQPRAATLSWDGTGIVVPGIEGTLSWRDEQVSATFLLADDKDALSAHVNATHDIATGVGMLALNDAILRFGRRKLSTHFVQWPYAWDALAGTWTTDLELRWRTGADGTAYAGTMTQRADALAGRYKDTAFAGLGTTLQANLDSAAGIVVAPASLAVALIDVGLPLEQITAEIVPDIKQQTLQVDRLSLATLGGRITADPFLFGINESQNHIMLRPQAIQLPFIMQLVDFADIELTGSISGVIPITMNDMKLTIKNGWLQSDPPGGVIRYLPGVELAASGKSGSALDTASRALANFQFDSLTSAVDYLENGEMKLQMKLSGSNPDWEGGQPVILNLAVDNNIPQMLRSLRATRSIEDILARKTRK